MPTHEAEGATITSASPNDLDKVAHQRDGLALVASVVVHLPAAGLGLGKLDDMAQSLQQLRGGDAHLRKQACR